MFSTKNREPWLVIAKEARIWEYLGGIARTNGMKALKVGGYDDHIHILLALPATIAVSKAVQLLKGASSRWIHENDNDMTAFAWSAPQLPVVPGLFSLINTRLLWAEELLRADCAVSKLDARCI